jgi:hypothetical protein
MGKKEIQALEDGLGSLALALPLPNGEDKLHFYDERYPGILWRYDQAKADLEKLGMLDLVQNAIQRCLPLVKEGRLKEAEHLLDSACGALRQKSGTWDEMRRMYTASNDAKGGGSTN